MSWFCSNDDHGNAVFMGSQGKTDLLGSPMEILSMQYNMLPCFFQSLSCKAPLFLSTLAMHMDGLTFT